MAPENQGPDNDKRDMTGTVGEVLETVAEHHAAVEAVEQRQKPKDRGRVLIGALVVLVVVAAWDVWILTKAPEGLPPEIVAADLHFDVQFAVEAVEDFRADEGRLPAAEEISDYLDDDVIYVTDGAGFSVTALDGDVQVTYDGSVPLEEWMAEVAAGGGS